MKKILSGGKRLSQYQMEDKMIQDILDNFDFKRCHDAMKALRWQWGFDEGTPTIEKLKESAVERLIGAMKEAKEDKKPNITYFSSSGGLKGNAWVNRYGQIEGVRLEFVLTDWDSDGDY